MTTPETELNDCVAIVGMAGRFPGAGNLTELWRVLAGSVETISRFERSELEPSTLEAPGIRHLPNYRMARGVLGGVAQFDPEFFGMTPREASVIDPQQRLLLELAWEAFEDAGYDPAAFDGTIGCWVGMAPPTYLAENVLENRGVLEQVGFLQAGIGNGVDYAATRVSYKLGLRGPSVNIFATDATSLVAVASAFEALLLRQCDVALVGAASVTFPQRRGALHDTAQQPTSGGMHRPYDASADGTTPGHGAGALVLKRVQDAIDAGDCIHAVVRAAASTQIASGSAAERVERAADLVQMVHAMAGVDPRGITYIEGHGAAVPSVDALEIDALSRAFRCATDARGFCALGSSAANTGHLGAASGVAGIIKIALALRHGVIPPTLNFAQAPAAVRLDASPFHIPTRALPWSDSSQVRRAAVSSLGSDGTCAYVVLEQPPRRADVRTTSSPKLLVLSARTAEGVRSMGTRLAEHLDARPELSLADVANTLQTGRRAFRFRQTVAASSLADAAEQLRRQATSASAVVDAVRSGVSVGMLFPGQGSQHLRMGAQLYAGEPVFREEFDACIDAAAPHLGFDLRELILRSASEDEAAATRLAETSVAQPALLSVELALAKLLMSWGLQPVAMLGHSLGEYVAACVAGVFTREDAVKLVCERGRLMQAQPRGAMLAVRAGVERISPLLPSGAAPAAVNAPEFTVVSGTFEAVAELEQRLTQQSIDHKRLITSHAFHSPSMEGALEPFRRTFDGVALSPPQCRWVSSVTGDWVTPQQAVSPEYWVRQLREPVQFSRGFSVLAQDKTLALIEVGPGRALTTLVRQHRDRPNQRMPVVTTLSPKGDDDQRSVLSAVGALWAAGAAPSWSALHPQGGRRNVSLPTYAFNRREHWIAPAQRPQAAIGAPRAAEANTDEQATPASVESTPSTQDAAQSAAAAPALQRVLQILAGVSGAAPQDLDPGASFLELGFDSLLLTQVTAKMTAAFGVHVALRDMLERWPSPAELADHLQAAAPAVPQVPTVMSQANAAAAPAHAEAAQPDADVTAEQAFPLTDAQREMMSVVQMGPEASCAYNQCLVLELRGVVDVESMRRALSFLTTRHEALRTRFDAAGTLQKIDTQGAPWVEVTDLTSLPEPERSSRALELQSTEVSTPFDLVAGPTARARVIVLGERLTRVVFGSHHILFDGWSSRMLFTELGVAYDAFLAGRQPALPAAVPFRRHLQYERTPQYTARKADALAYWLGRFADLPPALDLPSPLTRPAIKTYRGACMTRAMNSVSFQQVVGAASELRATPVAYLLTAFQVLLARLAGQRDVVVGLPVSIRDPQVASVLMGHATNLLPMRGTFGDDSSFGDAVRATQRALLDAQDHQSLTFGDLVPHLKLPRDLSRTPLVAAMFNVDRGKQAPVFAGCEALLTMPERRFANFEIELQVVVRDQQITLECTYNPDLFVGDDIARSLGHYETLLAGAIARADAGWNELSLLSARERATLEQGNRTEREYPRDVTLAQLFSAQAERSANRPALRMRDEVLTYADLERKAGALARLLMERGVGPGALVGLCLERSVNMVAALLAVHKAGAAYVPLDPGFPPERLAFMVEDSQMALVVSESALRDRHGMALERTLELDELGAKLTELSMTPSAATSRHAKPEDVAYVLYTSGSTGKPKGVQVPHRAVVNFLTSMAREPGLTADDVLLAVTTLSFDISVLELLLPLTVGAQIVLASRDDAMEGARVRELIERHGVTMMQATPVTWRLLIESGWRGSRAFKALCGGEPLPRDLATALQPLVGELWNMYGPTETTVWSSCCRVTQPEHGLHIGRPIANTTFWVLNERLQVCPIGVAGELYIGGDGLAVGYLHRRELTEERFVPHPWSAAPGQRLYRTGDVARVRADGNFDCLGRTDNQVKLRGYRIELGEIENALGLHPDVREAVAQVARPTGGEAELVAYVVLQPGQEELPRDLDEHLRAGLPRYMVPSRYMLMPSIPRTPNGKVDRKALPALGEAATAKPRVSAQAAKNDQEAKLLELLAAALRVPSLGRDDDFFEQGGDSLRAVAAIHSINAAFGLELTAGALFAHPTAAGLAELVEQRGGKTQRFVVALQRNAHVPTFFVCGIALYDGLARNLSDACSSYGVYVPEEESFLASGGVNGSIASLASAYVQAIRERTTGDVAVGGVSFGGVMAFEVARQLRALGQNVVGLVLLDAMLPHAVTRDWGRWAAQQSRKVAEGGLPYIVGRMRRIVAKRTQPAAPVSERNARNEQLWSVLHGTATRAYFNEHPSYDGPTLLVRADVNTGLEAYDIPLDLGWSPYLSGPLTLASGGSDHLGILTTKQTANVIAGFVKRG